MMAITMQAISWRHIIRHSRDTPRDHNTDDGRIREQSKFSLRRRGLSITIDYIRPATISSLIDRGIYPATAHFDAVLFRNGPYALDHARIIESDIIQMNYSGNNHRCMLVALSSRSLHGPTIISYFRAESALPSYPFIFQDFSL